MASYTTATKINLVAVPQIKTFTHDGEEVHDVGDKNSDVPLRNGRLSIHDHHPEEPAAVLDSSASSDGGGSDGPLDDLELQSANLKACVVFVGDTDSCSPHKFKPYTVQDKLGKGSYGIVFLVECELCGNVSFHSFWAFFCRLCG